MSHESTITLERPTPKIVRITFANPPVNLIVSETVTRLDEGTYLASQSTMYRLLAANGEVRERRDQLRRPNYTKPELLATKP